LKMAGPKHHNKQQQQQQQLPAPHFRNQSKVDGYMLTWPHAGPANWLRRQAGSLGFLWSGQDM
jgi:hypothetical protein